MHLLILALYMLTCGVYSTVKANQGKPEQRGVTWVINRTKELFRKFNPGHRPRTRRSLKVKPCNDLRID
ncbi:hypothetical protein ACTXT7_008280 [Hymenolepis weldensis]